MAAVTLECGTDILAWLTRGVKWDNWALHSDHASG